MTFNDPHHPWSRLTTAARQVRDERDTSAPYGFPTRIAALAYARDRRVASLMERFALRAVGVSCVIALLSVALNYHALSGPTVAATPTEDFTLPTYDAVAVVLDFAE
ncbi:MAG: hypothetical protein Q7S40_02895 [Opitutaceae bacterium]|nr:hypothetical protein [Opitutaceae bacterium]